MAGAAQKPGDFAGIAKAGYLAGNKSAKHFTTVIN